MTTTTLAPPLPVPVLADIACGIAAAPLWRSVVRHDPHRQHSVRLLATEGYEVWLIGWTTGQNVRLHDYGPSAVTLGGRRRADRGDPLPRGVRSSGR